MVAANSSTGASPRNRYIGLASELPPVSSSASRVPSASSHAATSRLSSSLEAAGDPVGHVELGGDRHPVADGVPHRPDDLAGEAGPVLQRAAVAVVPLVEPRAEEGAEQVVVAEVDLDGVEAGVHGQRRPAGVGSRMRSMSALGRRPDAAHGHRAERRRRRQARAAGRPGVGDRAGVADLGRGRRALGVDGVGEPRGGPARPRRAARGIAEAVRPSGATAQVGDGASCRPARATRRWYSTSSSVTTPSGMTPSKVAALMIRLRSVSGPSRAGAKGSGLTSSTLALDRRRRARRPRPAAAGPDEPGRGYGPGRRGGRR